MPNTREKLIKLLNIPFEVAKNGITLKINMPFVEQVADHLIANGVTVNEWIKEQTNADRIRAMSDEELADFIFSLVDEDSSHEIGCYGCINYGTHHSDPVNKGTNLYECDGCSGEGIGLDIGKWLKQPSEEG